MQRPLGERRERAHLLDLVPEELDAQRLEAGRREDVNEPAAHGELAAILGALDPLVAGESERLGQPFDALLLAGRDADRRRPRVLRRYALGDRRRRHDDQPAAVLDVERTRTLADEVRRRPQPGVPADTTAGQQCDALGPEVPPRRLREVPRIRVFGDEDDQRSAELVVQRRDDQWKRGLGHARACRQRGSHLLQALELEQLADERVQHGTVFARNLRFRAGQVRQARYARVSIVSVGRLFYFRQRSASARRSRALAGNGTSITTYRRQGGFAALLTLRSRSNSPSTRPMDARTKCARPVFSARSANALCAVS
jgi:hypothetical protein